MAESDGSLKIQVDLDTKGFKIGAKDLEAAAKRTAGKISDIGDQASASLKRQYNAVSELCDKYEKQQQKVERLRDELKKLSQQKVQTKEFTDLATEIDKAQTALERLYDRRDSRVALGAIQRIHIQAADEMYIIRHNLVAMTISNVCLSDGRHSFFPA